jgi:hypothetical protein
MFVLRAKKYLDTFEVAVVDSKKIFAHKNNKEIRVKC